MPAPSPHPQLPPEQWPSRPPAEPPYVDGPLRIVDPVPGLRPPVATTFPAMAATTEAAPPRRRRGLAAAAALAAALLFVASFAVTRYALTDDGSTTASAPTTTPTAPRTPPTTSTPPSGGGSGRQTPTPSTPSTDPTPDLSDQVAEVSPGIVNIVSLMPSGVGAGTGVVISADGDVVTNNHVIEGAEQIEVTIAGTDRRFAATVVGTDPIHDVAVIHLAAAEGLTTVPIGDSDDVRVGDPVAAVGNAGGLGGAPKVATGHVTALHQPVTAADETGGNVRTLTDLIQVDADVQSGDSGGPLVSEDGEVVGINVAASIDMTGRSGEPHVGFAIPINRVMSIAEDIQANPSPPAGSGLPQLGSGYLGVAAIDSTTTEGAEITSVQPSSPAAEAGLAEGDVITAVDSVRITGSTELVEALATRKGGDQATITWQSGSSTRSATVTLASR